jgi:prepilin-type processing-associated H-X9-DG protein/prepilin-type N-terminal cleavage/methylation domain-containing protein
LSTPSRRAAAFTLIEVIVAVSIILILLALLSGAAKRTYDAGLNASCAGHMKRIGDLFSSYLADNDGILPQRFVPSKQMGYDMQLVHGKGATNKQRREVFFCPAHKKVNKVQQISYGMNHYYDNASLLLVTNRTATILVAEVDGLSGEGSRMADRANYSIGTIAVTRHLKKSNYLFFDGHVESLSFSNTLSPLDLWGENQNLPKEP